VRSIQIGRVSYEIQVWDIRLSRNNHVIAGRHVAVHLRNHTLSDSGWAGHFLTLGLSDGPQVSGYLSDGGAAVTGAALLPWSGQAT
jgi:hypothetical protein